jgi:hypothetical protein
MKRTLNVTVLTLTAFVLLGAVSVMAIERPLLLTQEESPPLSPMERVIRFVLTSAVPVRRLTLV